MTQLTDPVPYANAEPKAGWIGRHSTGAAAIRMVAFAILALAGIGWRYLTTAVAGNADLPDGGKYVLFGACIGFAFEYAVSLVGMTNLKWRVPDSNSG